MTNNRTFFLILLACLFMVSCSPWRAQLLHQQWLAKSPQRYTLRNANPPLDSFSMSYIGCGGFLIQYGNDKLLIDPFFSNQSLGRISTKQLRPDHQLIQQFFTRELGTPDDDQGLISAVLISHAHYDHLGDMPFLLKDYLHNPVVTMYGSRTAVNLVRSFGLPIPDTARQLQNLEPFFTTHATKAGQNSELPASPFFYLPGGRIRFSAIPSNHVGHYRLAGQRKLPFTPGQVDQPPVQPAYFGLKYKEGQNYNFVIDLLNESGKPVFRIFSNAGAACDASVGYLPEEMLQDKPVDLLLLCGANYNVADQYPQPLLDYIQPRILFMAHWENFFKPVPKIQKRASIVPNTNILKLMGNLEKYAAKKGYPEKILIEYPQKRQIQFRF